LRIVIQSQFVWVFVGHVAEKIAGVRSGVRLVSKTVRSHAALCLACDQYNLFNLLRIGGSMRKDAVWCGGAKITFRVRCIQPSSATSPPCLQPVNRCPRSSVSAGDPAVRRPSPVYWRRYGDCNARYPEPNRSPMLVCNDCVHCSTSPIIVFDKPSARMRAHMSPPPAAIIRSIFEGKDRPWLEVSRD
jgi:hypothetical protein